MRTPIRTQTIFYPLPDSAFSYLAVRGQAFEIKIAGVSVMFGADTAESLVDLMRSHLEDITREQESYLREAGG